jgi:hypothetical protein
MKKFTREEIDKWRSIFVERKYPQKEVNLDSHIVNYFVTPANLFQGIPNGLFRMTGNPSDGYVVGVSDEVPLEIQPHFAVSEHDEFMVFGLEDLERTLHSEKNMLRILNENSHLRRLYAANKLILYEYMILNARDNLDKWGFTEQDYAGFVKAFDYLKSAI